MLLRHLISKEQQQHIPENELDNYTVLAQGTTHFIYYHNQASQQPPRLLSIFKSFDSAQLVCDPQGYAVANLLGTRRFLVGEAQTLASATAHHEAVDVIAFKRDLTFSLHVTEQELRAIPYRVVDLKTLLQIYQGKEINLFVKLAALYKNCADYTPAKMAEFQHIKSLLYRFNIENTLTPNADTDVVSDHVILLDDDQEIIGMMSASIYKTRGYLYDEIVNYPRYLGNNDKTPENIERVRLQLFSYLFPAMRHQLKQTICKLNHLTAAEYDAALHNQTISAFIRAADGRVATYQALGCGPHFLGAYVVHGPCLEAGERLHADATKWVENKYAALLEEFNQLSAEEIAQLEKQSISTLSPTPPYSLAAVMSRSRYGTHARLAVTEGSEETVKLESSKPSFNI